MIIGISPLLYDPVGALLLNCVDAASDTGNYTRRVTRTKTLDGGVVLFDGGYTPGDRTVTVQLDAPSQLTVDAVRYVFQAYAKVLLFLSDGAFIAAPSTMTETAGRVRVSFLLEKAGEVKID